MASTGGLTRRRGGAGGGGAGSAGSDEGERSSSPAASRPRDSVVGSGETAYTTENGHKIGLSSLYLSRCACMWGRGVGVMLTARSVRSQGYQREPGEEQVAEVDAYGGDIAAGFEG
jgi:hypothetical protein